MLFRSGKQPLAQSHGAPRVEQRPPPKKTQVIASQDEEPIKKKKSRCCYLCRGKGHFASSCTNGTSSSPIIIDDAYSLRKDRVGNVCAKYVGAQLFLSRFTPATMSYKFNHDVSLDFLFDILRLVAS